MRGRAWPWILGLVVVSLSAVSLGSAQSPAPGVGGPRGLSSSGVHLPPSPTFLQSGPPALPTGLDAPGPLALPSSVTVIWPNGTVSNASAPITRSLDVYTVTANFTGSLLLERNGSVLDGAGHVLDQAATANWSVEVFGASNATVENFQVIDASLGIAVLNSQDVLIERNSVVSLTGFGLAVQSSYRVEFANNTAAFASGGMAAASTDITWSDNAISSTMFGISLQQVSNVSLTSNRLSGDLVGIFATYSQSLKLWGNNVTSDAQYGIYLSADTNVAVDWNNGSATGSFLLAQSTSNLEGSWDSAPFTHIGVSLYSVSNVTLQHLDLSGALLQGVFVARSNQVTIVDSNLTSTHLMGVDAMDSQGLNFSRDDLSHFVGGGFDVEDSVNVVVANNLLDFGVPGSNSTILTVADQNVLVASNSAPHSYNGITDAGSHGIRIAQNDFSSSTVGILLSYTANATVTANDLVNSTGAGLSAFYVLGLEVVGNDGSGSTGVAFQVYYSASITVSGNDGSGSGLAFRLFSDTDFVLASNDASRTTPVVGVAIDVVYSASGEVFNNTDVQGGRALGISFSTNIQAWGNNLSNAYWGMYLVSDTQVTIWDNQLWSENFSFLATSNIATSIFHNNFGTATSGWILSNSYQGLRWDTGYPGGGNFWANFTSPDTMSGPSQNLPGRDGIVDTALVLNATNVDHYPLAAPWAAPTLTFVASGLPAGTPWSVTVNGTTVRSTSTTAVFPQTAAALGSSYAYTVAEVPGYRPSPATGSVSPHGLDANVAITFSPYTFNVTFTETGLGPGATWNVTLGSLSSSSTGGSISFEVGNGTYTYRVTAAGYSGRPASGTLTVTGAGRTVDLTFQPVTYAVTFTESGLSGGTSWSVTLGGSTLSSNSDTIRFDVPNGSYAFSVVGVSGFSASPSSGQVGVSGGNASQGVAFTSVPSLWERGLTSPPVAYGLLAAAVILGILAVVGFSMWRRAKRGPPPAAAPWAGPGGPT